MRSQQFTEPSLPITVQDYAKCDVCFETFWVGGHQIIVLGEETDATETKTIGLKTPRPAWISNSPHTAAIM